ncbi:hypothetical protein ScPMuIL_013943 [Solemya velum]
MYWHFKAFTPLNQRVARRNCVYIRKKLQDECSRNVNVDIDKYLILISCFSQLQKCTLKLFVENLALESIGLDWTGLASLFHHHFVVKVRPT